MFGHDSPRTNQGTLMRILTVLGQRLLGQCAPTRGIDGASMPSVDQYLAILDNVTFGIVSESNDGVQHGGGTMTIDSQTDRRLGSRM